MLLMFYHADAEVSLILHQPDSYVNLNVDSEEQSIGFRMNEFLAGMQCYLVTHAWPHLTRSSALHGFKSVSFCFTPIQNLNIFSFLYTILILYYGLL